MAFAGLKKQINKANQFMTEKMGGAEGTKLDHDFMEMERKVDVTVELVEELQTKTKEYLQPNPTARARMQAVKGISKLSGQAKSNTYPQPEGTLADCMLLYGKKLGDDSYFAQSLIEFGDSLKQVADVKYSLDDRVKQNFLEPLHQLQMKDLKEVMHHRKKLQGRRLDFDCKRRRQAKAGSNITDDEIRGAEDKFAESWQLAQMGMFNLLENDVEQVAQLCGFAEAMLEYHEQCTEIIKVLVEVLNQKRDEAADRPKSDFQPKTLADLSLDGGSTHGSDGVNAHHISAKTTNPIMYSSQQNLSTLATTTSNHNRNVHNINSSISNYNNNKVYGSQQSLSSATTRGTSFDTAKHKSSHQHTAGNNNNNNNNNNLYNSSSNGSRNTNNNNHVDSWLNAWDSPNPPIPAARQAAAPKPSHNRNLNKQFSDPWSSASPLPSPMRSPAKTPNPQVGPCCTALYDFEPENPGELGFKENDVIQLINKVDENWFEGSVRGRTGYFPQSYVTVTVPLP